MKRIFRYLYNMFICVGMGTALSFGAMLTLIIFNGIFFAFYLGFTFTFLMTVAWMNTYGLKKDRRKGK